MEIETLRHSCAHILAAAVQEIYPKTKFGIGPAITDAFYYDFDLSSPISEKDFPKIEKRMREIIKKDLIFKKKIISEAEAKKIFKNQPYKLQLIKELAKQKAKISIYQVGEFIDLCKGPHINSSKQIPIDGFKLTKIAGAYWQGEEKNKMLTRIYGTVWPSKKKLKDYLERIKEAEKRDHRFLGKKLGLFMFDPEIGPGLPLWLPKGETIRHIVEDYLYNELNKAGYQWVRSPHIANLKLWKTSGHWNFYKENMYSPIKIDEDEYMLKPMNCPFHIKIYNSGIHSYKNLPIRFAELGTVYRYEKSGVLHGLTRVRGFTQDDAHIFCTPEQMPEELLKTTKLGIQILKIFGFEEFRIFLSTRPDKYVGSEEKWKKATTALKQTLSALNLNYEIDKGGGVFYGPKIDIKIKDSLGRLWQCTTIQVDFNLPQRFNMFYVDKKGKKKEPIMIHRALLGSVERFMGVLIEHYAGAFPLWLAPIQVWIVPISEKHQNYGKKIEEELKRENFRVELKDENESVSKKIRNSEIQKIPYTIVIGDKEIKDKKIRVRSLKKGDLGEMALSSFSKKIKIETDKRQ